MLPDNVRDLLSNSLASATKRAYASDLRHFEAWGGMIPASPEMVATYLAHLTIAHKSATIQRRVASISKAHQAAGANNPTKTEIVRATMRGIRRTLGTAQRQAQALLRDDLFAVLDRLGDRPKDARDRAMLIFGFSTAMRRSELVALDVGDVEFTTRGALVTLRRSKTDQEAAGRKIAVPFGRTRHCPVAALIHWLEIAAITAGPIFLAMNKHGHILRGRISGEVVSNVIKTRLENAGYDPADFSGHSLRSGFATAAVMAGASTYKVRQTTGHRSEASLARYIRDVDLFDDAASGRLL
ncbi:integrase [Mesorhizobium sp. LSHC420B00]|nr:integrase [Mesorhizobium sp. LSHC420B00]